MYIFINIKINTTEAFRVEKMKNIMFCVAEEITGFISERKFNIATV